MRAALLLLAACGLAFVARAAETLPPKPADYFNDYAHVVSPAAAARLNAQLRQFDEQTSNQIVVAVFPKFPSDSSLEDYCERVFVSWKVGQRKLDNGAILFVFAQDHLLRIQTGFGLEGALPDILCSHIIQNEIAPRFKEGNYDAGLAAGVTAMMQATRNEYKGTATPHVQPRRSSGYGPGLLIFLFIAFFILRAIFSSRSSAVYGGGGRGFFTGLLLSSLLNSGSRGSFSGGGGFGGGDFGGGGGFSGGGGDSGGGGASGSW